MCECINGMWCMCVLVQRPSSRRACETRRPIRTAANSTRNDALLRARCLHPSAQRRCTTHNTQYTQPAVTQHRRRTTKCSVCSRIENKFNVSQALDVYVAKIMLMMQPDCFCAQSSRCKPQIRKSKINRAVSIDSYVVLFDTSTCWSAKVQTENGISCSRAVGYVFCVCYYRARSRLSRR